MFVAEPTLGFVALLKKTHSQGEVLPVSLYLQNYIKIRIHLSGLELGIVRTNIIVFTLKSDKLFQGP